MASAKKKSTTSGLGGPKTKAVAAAAAAVALERLRDPKVQAMLAEQARLAAERAKAWRDERKADPSAKSDKALPSKLGALGDRLEQRRLERRVRSLKASVAELASGRPELAEQLMAPTAALTSMTSALSVAGGLPREKQHRAHVQVGQELDLLEATVFDVAMPKSE